MVGAGALRRRHCRLDRGMGRRGSVQGKAARGRSLLGRGTIRNAGVLADFLQHGEPAPIESRARQHMEVLADKCAAERTCTHREQGQAACKSSGRYMCSTLGTCITASRGYVGREGRGLCVPDGPTQCKLNS